MEKITITIETGNDAFQDGNYFVEVAKILKGLADRFQFGATPDCHPDSNGNYVCKVRYE